MSFRLGNQGKPLFNIFLLLTVKDLFGILRFSNNSFLIEMKIWKYKSSISYIVQSSQSAHFMIYLCFRLYRFNRAAQSMDPSMMWINIGRATSIQNEPSLQAETACMLQE